MHKNVQSHHVNCVTTLTYYKIAFRSHSNCLSSPSCHWLYPLKAFPVSLKIDEIRDSQLRSSEPSLAAQFPELFPFSEVVIPLKRFKKFREHASLR
jgi:hypothetical protein